MPVPERSANSRARLYDAIERAARAFPDSRVAQILVNAAPMPDIFHFEDDQLAQFIHKYVDQSIRNGTVDLARRNS